MADISLGDVTARLSVDLSQWQRGLQQAQQQLGQFQRSVTQQVQQGVSQTAQASRADVQLRLAAIREQMQAARQAAQAHLQIERQSSTARLQAAQQASAAGLQAARQASTAAIQAARQASAERIAAARAAGQAEVLEFRRSTEAARQAAREQAQAARQAAQVQRAAAAGGGGGGFGQQALAVAGGIGIATSIGGITAAMVSFGQSVVKVGTDLQQLRASLANVAGGITQGQQAFTFITDTANRYGLSLTTLAQSYRSLTAATRGTALEGEGTQRLFTAISAASRTLGLSSEQTGRALVAFQQIISKGKVSQEELRQQLGEALPGAMQVAARAFGVTTAQLDAMITKGLDATEFVRRFTAQLEREMPQGAKGVETAAMAFNRLGNEILLLKEKIAQSGLLAFLTSAASGAATLLETLRKADEQRRRFLEGETQKAWGPPHRSVQRPTQARRVVQQLDRGPRRTEGPPSREAATGLWPADAAHCHIRR